RSLTNTFSGIRPVDLPGFIVAELLGALIALALMGWLLRPEIIVQSQPLKAKS
ncbi:aquaporin family protein, partial [Bradyrhizobium sp. Arg314]